MPNRSYHLKRTIVMIGMMGAGKTAVGKEVARILQVPFLDSDEEIVQAANMSIQEIFARDGEPFFRARESEVLRRLLDGPPLVLSTGGGAYLAPDNRDLISRKGTAVWLNADIELLWNRVRLKTTRPLLQTADPKATLRALYDQRLPIYAKAELEVKSDPRLSVPDMAAKVIGALLDHADLLEEVTRNDA